jgi:DNA-binding response OmpR family regulator
MHGHALDCLVLEPEGDPHLRIDGDAGRVIAVSAGSEFVRLLAELLPRLVLMTSPPAGPPELLAAAEVRRRRPTLRLVFLNDAADVTGRLAALAQGFDEALPLSIQPDELTGRVLRLLRDEVVGSDDEQPISIGWGAELDLVGRRLRRQGVEIHLRPREYALLAHLAGHPGRVFSRAELVRQVWGVAYSGGSRTVDVHIRWLRAKIEQDPARPAHLTTVRGIGYRFDPPERSRSDG